MQRQKGAETAAEFDLEDLPSFSQAMGASLRRRRLELHLTAQDIAYAAEELGIGWDRSTVTRIEAGKRHLSAAELLLLPLLFECSVANLLPDERCALTPVASGPPKALRQGLTEPPSVKGWWLPQLMADVRLGVEQVAIAFERSAPKGVPAAIVMQAAVHGRDEATAKAARRLGTTPLFVATAAEETWGHGLAKERDRRVAEQDEPEAERQRRAARGHVTRVLLDELKPRIAKYQEEQQ